MPIINPENIGGDLAKIFAIEFGVLAIVVIVLILMK